MYSGAKVNDAAGNRKRTDSTERKFFRINKKSISKNTQKVLNEMIEEGNRLIFRVIIFTDINQFRTSQICFALKKTYDPADLFLDTDMIYNIVF